MIIYFYYFIKKMKDKFLEFYENFQNNSSKENLEFLKTNSSYIISVFNTNGMIFKGIYFRNQLMSFQGQIELNDEIGLYQFDEKEFLELLQDFIQLL